MRQSVLAAARYVHTAHYIMENTLIQLSFSKTDKASVQTLAKMEICFC